MIRCLNGNIWYHYIRNLFISLHQTPNKSLELLHGSDIGGLDPLLELGDLLLELIEGDLVVLNDHVDLELLDTEADGDELGATPDETILLNATDGSLKSDHVGLIICNGRVSTNASSVHHRSKREHTPGLDIHGDDGLGSDLGLGSLLLAVGSETLLTDTGSLSILLLIVGAEKVDILLLLGGSLGGLGGVDGDLGDLRAVGGVGGRRVTGEGGELVLVGGDVLVPAGSVGVLLGGGSILQGLEDGNISLGGSVAIRGCALARACRTRTRVRIDEYPTCCWTM